jgi:tetratricopeptide (TPR) repeat protein
MIRGCLRHIFSSIAKGADVAKKKNKGKGPRRSSRGQKGRVQQPVRQQSSRGGIALFGALAITVGLIALVWFGGRGPSVDEVAPIPKPPEQSAEQNPQKPPPEQKPPVQEVDPTFWNDDVEAKFGADTGAANEYKALVQLYSAGTLRSGEARLRTLLAGADEGAAWREEAELLMAQAQSIAGDHVGGIEAVQAWRSKHGDSHLMGWSHLFEGEAYQRQVQARKNEPLNEEDRGDLAVAASAYERAMELDKSESLAAVALYDQGVVSRMADDSTAAIEAFDAVWKRFPDSPKAPQALTSLYKQYWAQEDYDAARTAVGDLLKQYPNSKAVKGARNDAQALSVLGKPARDWGTPKSWWGKRPKSLSDMRDKTVYLLFLETW